MTNAEKVAQFKARWAEADANGMEGHRVEYALVPLLEAAWEEGQISGILDKTDAATLNPYTRAPVEWLDEDKPVKRP